ncbi:MAG: hypothetical protein LRY73_01245 [Bacillus sp. (in: Bacteria)]|nr:hypothetical protein [Bacillus sp. (in: firmicutes)]
MSIQKKLILSYGAMIVIPILLFSIVVGAMYIIFSSEEGWWNPANDMERIEHRNSIFAELKLVTTDNPDMLVDQGFLQKMDETLGDWKYGLFMRVDNDVIYSSDQGFDKAIATEFSTFGSFTTHTHESVMVNGNPYKFRQHDFYLPDGRKGSIFFSRGNK